MRVSNDLVVKMLEYGNAKVRLSKKRKAEQYAWIICTCVYMLLLRNCC